MAYKCYPASVTTEERILLYIKNVQEGWGLPYSRALSGLREGNKHYLVAIKDPRVIKLHKEYNDRINEKFRGKLTNKRMP